MKQTSVNRRITEVCFPECLTLVNSLQLLYFYNISIEFIEFYCISIEFIPQNQNKKKEECKVLKSKLYYYVSMSLGKKQFVCRSECPPYQIFS